MQLSRLQISPKEANCEGSQPKTGSKVLRRKGVVHRIVVQLSRPVLLAAATDLQNRHVQKLNTIFQGCSIAGGQPSDGVRGRLG